MKRAWLPDEDETLRINYPKFPAFLIAYVLDRGVSGIYGRAHLLGLTKATDFYHQWHTPLWAGYDHPAKVAHRFAKGSTPFNKGMRRPGWAPGRMKETQFQKGRPASAARNYVPIGTEKIDSKRGVLVRKMTDDPQLVPVMRWRPVHVMVWEAAHGPIPHGHIVRFRHGMKTHNAGAITVDRLELVTQAQNMRLNTLHRYPPGIVHAIQLRGALNRTINRREKAIDHV